MGFFDARFGGYLVVAALVRRHALLAGWCAASFTTLGNGWEVFCKQWLRSRVSRSYWSDETVVYSIWKLVGAAYLGYLGLRSLIGTVKSTKLAAVLTSPAQKTHWVNAPPSDSVES